MALFDVVCIEFLLKSKVESNRLHFENPFVEVRHDFFGFGFKFAKNKTLCLVY
jgi:hypothetical protein